MKLNEQARTINHPGTEDIKVPVMPLLLVKPNRTMGEAKTIRGAVALAVGNHYYDAEDAYIEWHDRLAAARKIAMIALANDIDVVIYDKKKGDIKENYAAAPGDPDYEPNNPPIKINITTEKTFLLSLAKLGAIRLLEREDSYILRPHSNYDISKQCCKKCKYKLQGDTFICPVYNEKKQELEGRCCNSYVIPESNIEEYKGGAYIDIAAQFDIDELIKKYE